MKDKCTKKELRELLKYKKGQLDAANERNQTLEEVLTETRARNLKLHEALGEGRRKQIHATDTLFNAVEDVRSFLRIKHSLLGAQMKVVAVDDFLFTEEQEARRIVASIMGDEKRGV